jgi:hypothetical protein
LLLIALRELNCLGLSRRIHQHDIIVTVKATASPFTLRACWPAQLLASIWSNSFAMIVVNLMFGAGLFRLLLPRQNQ